MSFTVVLSVTFRSQPAKACQLRKEISIPHAHSNIDLKQRVRELFGYSVRSTYKLILSKKKKTCNLISKFFRTVYLDRAGD